MRLAILLCFVVCTFAQVPTRCDSPVQWEGKQLYSNDRSTFEIFKKIIYDAKNKRVRTIEFGNSQHEYYDILFLYNAGIKYTYNIKTKTCKISVLTDPFVPVGVPSGAKFLYQYTIGAVGIPGEYVTISKFNGTLPDESATYVMTVTEPDCIPVRSLYYNNVTGSEFIDYYDISLGIPDSKAFVPRPECHLLLQQTYD